MNLELLLAVAAPVAKVAAQPQTWLDSFKGGNLPFNWFDIAVVAVLAIGFKRGRKHGMSEEMMYLLQWIVMILGAAWAYQPGGDWLVSVCPVSHLASYITAYITTALVIRIFFLIFRKLVGGKLIGSNIFFLQRRRDCGAHQIQHRPLRQQFFPLVAGDADGGVHQILHRPEGQDAPRRAAHQAHGAGEGRGQAPRRMAMAITLRAAAIDAWPA
ncbi:MAG: CvpA family protein [Verrucomicrobia bacterium]|nr:CvpA family protein [Verrucomicrobiota bacterium]